MIRSFLPFAAATAALSFVLAACSPAVGGGGCPWTHASGVTVAPASAAACLSAHVANADGSSGPGGCVDPDVVVDNRCSDSVVVSDVDAVEGETVRHAEADAGDGGSSSVTVTPGASAEVEAPGTGDGSYTLHATLGATPVTLTFSTSR